MIWQLRPTGREQWAAEVLQLLARADAMAKDQDHAAAAAAALALDFLQLNWPALNPAIVAASCRLSLKARMPLVWHSPAPIQYAAVPQLLARYLGEHPPVDPDNPPPPLILARVELAPELQQLEQADPVPPPAAPMPVEVHPLEQEPPAPPADPLEPTDLGDAAMQPWECGHEPGPPEPAAAPADMGGWFTTAEAAQLLEITPAGLTRLISALPGLVPGIHYARAGRGWSWSAAGVELCEQRPRRPPAEPPDARRAAAAEQARQRRAEQRRQRLELEQEQRDAQALADLDRLLPALL